MANLIALVATILASIAVASQVPNTMAFVTATQAIGLPNGWSPNHPAFAFIGHVAKATTSIAVDTSVHKILLLHVRVGCKR